MWFILDIGFWILDTCFLEKIDFFFMAVFLIATIASPTKNADASGDLKDRPTVTDLSRPPLTKLLYILLVEKTCGSFLTATN